MKQATRTTLPVTTEILGVYCLSTDNDRDNFRPALEQADAFAQQLIAESGDDCLFFEQIEVLAKAIGRPDGDDVDEAYERGRAGFLLGFAVALRLQAAVTGGAR